MYVTDLEGDLIKVTDLNEAIKISAEFKEYKHVDESFAEIDRKNQAYWTDLHNKLIAIRNHLKNTNKS